MFWSLKTYRVFAVATLLLVAVHSAANDVADLEVKCKASPTCAAKMNEMETQMMQTKSGVEITKEMAAILGDRKFEKSVAGFSQKCSKMSKKVGRFLAAMGPAAELIGSFFATVEEQLLEQIIETLKKEFQIVNHRFDGVFDKLSDMTGLMKDQHLRTQYRVAKDRIVHSSEVMHLMLQSSKASMVGYRKQVKDLKGKSEVEFSAYRLEQGLRDGRFIAVFMEAENSNRLRVQERLMEHYNLISQAVKFYLFWLELKSEDLPAHYPKAFRASEKSRWEAKLVFDLGLIEQFDAQYFTNQWQNKFASDFEQQVMKGGTNAEVASRAYQFLSGKYDWREWLIVIYDPISGWENHAIGRCGGIVHFRWHNRNVFVTHVKPGKTQSQSLTETYLSQAVTQTKKKRCGKILCHDYWKNVDDAEKIFNTFPHDLLSCISPPGGFPIYQFFSVIRESANVQVRAPSGRSITVSRNGMQLIAMS